MSMNDIAIYSKEKTVSYKELFSLIKRKIPVAVFVATPTLETIVNIFACILSKTPFYPISPREPHLPSVPPLTSDLCSCLMTSGTTATPKFATHTWENHLTSALNPHKDLTLLPTDRWYLSLPLNHIGGLAILFRCFLHGAAVILPDLAQANATFLSFVPTQLKRYLENPYPLPHIRAILVGGATISESLCRSAYERGLPLFLTYGMTEMSSQIATAPYHPSTGITFGFPLPHRELKIHSDGEIYVKGKTLFAGYLNRRTPLDNGWFLTSDIGEITAHGLILKGRKDNMIISGGENIHLEEIEKALLDITEIAGAKVFPRKDPEYGERPVARISLSSPIEIDTIIGKLKEILPSYKVPSKTDFLIVSEPPK